MGKGSNFRYYFCDTRNYAHLNTNKSLARLENECTTFIAKLPVSSIQGHQAMPNFTLYSTLKPSSELFFVNPFTTFSSGVDATRSQKQL